MRVVSWNLARNTTARSNAVHERGWHALAALDPDIALLQEAMPPAWVSDRWNVIKAPTNYWGSAILAKPALGLRPIEPEPATHWDNLGYVASGSVTLVDGSDLFLGSVHAPWMQSLSLEFLAGYDPDSIKLPGDQEPRYYDVPYAIFKDRVAARFLVSGDWNISPFLWDQHHRNSRQFEFFDRAREDGWVDCYRVFHEGEGRTWFRGSDRHYQMDHAFADSQTAGSLKSCEIDAYPAATLRVSDHAVLVMDF